MEEKINVLISRLQDGICSGSLKPMGDLEDVRIVHNQCGGKNEISVEINGKLVFRYDSTKKGRIENNIQITDEEK